MAKEEKKKIGTVAVFNFNGPDMQFCTRMSGVDDCGYDGKETPTGALIRPLTETYECIFDVTNRNLCDRFIKRS